LFIVGERAWDRLLESEGIDFNVETMNESWKEKLEDIRKENAVNHLSLDDVIQSKLNSSS